MKTTSKTVKQIINKLIEVLALWRSVAIAATCFIAGIGSGLSFGSNQYFSWIAPILALAVLFTATWDATPKRASLLAFLFGAGHFGAGVSWTYNSLHVYGNIPLVATIFIALCFSLFLALFYAAALWLGRKIDDGRSIPFALANLVASWVLFEHIRTWLFSGFGWLALGYAQVPRSPLAGFLPILGTFGVTAIGAIAAALFCHALLARNQLRSMPALVCLVLLVVSGALLKRVSYVEPAGEPFTASILQGAVPQQRQWLAENISKLPERYYQLAQRAKGKLIVAPESAYPFHWENFTGEQLEKLKKLLVKNNAVLVAGTYSRDEETGQSYNSIIAFDENHQWHYNKRHLVPYGEYLPFAAFFEPVLKRVNIPFANLKAGTTSSVIELPFAKILLTICYESLFPELFIDEDAEMFINVTNDSWFDGTLMPFQHLQVAQARAMEYQRWLIRASNTGPSAFISPTGRLRPDSKGQHKSTKNYEVVPLKGNTPYAIWGNYPTLIVTFIVLLFRRSLFQLIKARIKQFSK